MNSYNSLIWWLIYLMGLYLMFGGVALVAITANIYDHVKYRGQADSFPHFLGQILVLDRDLTLFLTASCVVFVLCCWPGIFILIKKEQYESFFDEDLLS